MSLIGLFISVFCLSGFSQTCEELREAIEKGELEVATTLIHNGTPINCPYKNNLRTHSIHTFASSRSMKQTSIQFPIHLIGNIDENYSKWLQLFKDNEVDINTLDSDNQTLLHKAAIEKNSDLIEAILAFNPNLNIADKKKQTPIYLLMDNETSVDLVRKMLDAGAVPSKTEKSKSVLFQAFKYNNNSVANYLVSKGLSPWETNEQMVTCLDIAIENNNYELVELAIKSGMTAKDARMENLTNEKIIKYLLQHEANIQNIQLNNVITYTNNAALVKWLIQAGANPDQKGFMNQTPLYHAIKKNNFELIQFLIEAKVDVQRQFEGSNYLTLATEQEPFNGEIIKYLIGKNVPIWGIQKTINHVVVQEDKERLQFLIDNGVDLSKVKIEQLASIDFGEFLIEKGVNIHNFEVKTIIADGNIELLKYLEKQKVNFDAVNAIYHATVSQQLDILKYLIKKNYNPNLQYQEGNWHYTPLMKAVGNQDFEVIKLLVAAKASINAINDKGETVLQLAILAKNNQILTYLLAQEINFKKINSQHTMLLIKACIDNGETKILGQLIGSGLNISEVSLVDFLENDDPTLINILVQHNVGLSVPNKKGQTPLYYAFKKRYYDTVNYLLEKGVGINDVILAEYMNSQKRFDHLAIQFLVEEGVDMNIAYLDKTPLQIAIEKDDLKMVRYLVENGADTTSIKAYKMAKKMNAATTIVQYLKETP